MKTIVKEKESNTLFEAQLFEDFALVRHVGGNVSDEIEKLDYLEYSDRFEDFWGDPTPLLRSGAD